MFNFGKHHLNIRAFTASDSNIHWKNRARSCLFWLLFLCWLLQDASWQKAFWTYIVQHKKLDTYNCNNNCSQVCIILACFTHLELSPFGEQTTYVHHCGAHSVSHFLLRLCLLPPWSFLSFLCPFCWFCHNYHLKPNCNPLFVQYKTRSEVLFRKLQGWLNRIGTLGAGGNVTSWSVEQKKKKKIDDFMTFKMLHRLSLWHVLSLLYCSRHFEWHMFY